MMRGPSDVGAMSEERFAGIYLLPARGGHVLLLPASTTTTTTTHTHKHTYKALHRATDTRTQTHTHTQERAHAWRFLFQALLRTPGGLAHPGGYLQPIGAHRESRGRTDPSDRWLGGGGWVQLIAASSCRNPQEPGRLIVVCAA